MKVHALSLKRTLLVFACVGIAALLTSCATEGQRLMNEGASPAYAQGFDDGCSSGKKSAGDMFSQFHKNVQEFRSNQDYRQGWNDGHEECRNEWLSMNRQRQLSIEEQRAADEHSLIKSMEKDNNQQYLPKLTPKEIEELKRLGH
jgi:hypothetical protein